MVLDKVQPFAFCAGHWHLSSGPSKHKSKKSPSCLLLRQFETVHNFHCKGNFANIVVVIDISVYRFEKLFFAPSISVTAAIK